jgi:glutamate synthase (NADPH/NADH) small chain
MAFNEPDLQVTQRGTIKIDFNTMMSEIDGVFAAGDIVRGAGLVVWGIKDGRDAASNIHNYLEEKNSAFANQSSPKVANVI